MLRSLATVTIVITLFLLGAVQLGLLQPYFPLYGDLLAVSGVLWGLVLGSTIPDELRRRGQILWPLRLAAVIALFLLVMVFYSVVFPPSYRLGASPVPYMDLASWLLASLSGLPTSVITFIVTEIIFLRKTR